MKFKMNFGTLKTALLGIMIALAFAVVILDVLLLAGVFGDGANKVVAGVSMGICLLMAGAFMAVLFGSHYGLKDDHLKVSFGIFSDKVKYSSVTLIRQNLDTKEVYIAVDEGRAVPAYVKINLVGAEADKFASELAGKCGMLVDYFTPEKKDKK